MRKIHFRIVTFVAVILALVIPAVASANAPSVPSLENRCGGFQWIGGHNVCLMPSRGEVSVEGNVVTFAHNPAPMGEASMSVIVRTYPGGVEAIRISGAVDVYFYADLNNAYADRYVADENGNIVIQLPDHGTSAFYIGSVGPVGHQFTLTFGSLSDFEGAQFIDSIPYAWNYWTRN